MDLEQLRQQIDDIDSRLIALLLQRMEITGQVAAYKIKHNLPVLNSGREQQVLDRITERSGSYGDGMKIIFSTIMDVSRANQHSLMHAGAELRASLASAKKMDFNTFHGVVACPGLPGAYSSEAAKRMFPSGQLAYYTGFEDVFLAVKDGKADFGVVPVENSTSGSVHETYDHIMKYRFSIAKGYDLSIRQCLCALPGVKLEHIKRVYSKAEALAQCKDYIKRHNMEAIPYSNTAAAAEFLSKSGLKDSGAVCARHAAEEYGLCVLDDQIQINKNNTTRFIAISKNMIINEDADKISLILAVPHVTGSLYKVLGQFSMYGMNLTKLESRPHSNSGFKYNFYLDLAGNVKDQKTADLLCALSADLPEFTFLGNFREIV